MEHKSFKNESSFSEVQKQLSTQFSAINLDRDLVPQISKISEPEQAILESCATHNLLAQHSLAISQLLAKIEGDIKIDPDNPAESQTPREAADHLLSNQNRANCLF